MNLLSRVQLVTYTLALAAVFAFSYYFSTYLFMYSIERGWYPDSVTTYEDVYNLFFVYRIACMILSIGLVLLIHRYTPKFTETDLGEKSSPLDTVVYLIIGGLMYKAVTWLYILKFVSIGDNLLIPSYVALAIVIFKVVIFSPIVEEVIFRRFIFNFMEYKIEVFWAMVISSILFSLAHYSNDDFVEGFIARFLFGMILAYVYFRTRKIVVPIILHMYINWVAIMANTGYDVHENGMVHLNQLIKFL